MNQGLTENAWGRIATRTFLGPTAACVTHPDWLDFDHPREARGWTDGLPYPEERATLGFADDELLNLLRACTQSLTVSSTAPR
jgi:hypothetical protein